MSVRMISFGDVEDAALVDDIDKALVTLQFIAGITNGDVAAVAFSGFDWEHAKIISRIARIWQWLVLERSYEEDEKS